MKCGTLTMLGNIQHLEYFCSIWSHSLPGLSKAARVGHLKAIVSMAFFHMCGATSDDIIYITLPLYHMSASLLGIGGCIHLGKNSCTSINVEFKAFGLHFSRVLTYPQCLPGTLRLVLHPPID